MDSVDKTTRALIALQYVEELGNRKKEALLSALGDPSEVFLPSAKMLISKILGDASATTFRKRLDEVDRIIDNMKMHEVHWVTYLDDEYPENLLEIGGNPIVLFLKGNLSLLSKKSIAVVGTRRPTRYGAKVCDSFVREFANAGLVVVSGFARGIDSIAHKVCVETSMPTIAVFACGIDTCYPAEHRGLLDGILCHGGLIVSEYGLGIKPLQYHFPERNRIISGLSVGVFLPEATLKSGSLITVRCGIEQGREIFIVPGNINSPESEGCNDILREIPQAFTIDPSDVFDVLRIKKCEKREQVLELTLVENLITEALHDGELHFEELMEATGITVSELNTTLMNLELNGILEQTSGNYYNLC